MKKIIVILFALVVSISINAQEKLTTKTGTVIFEASTDNFEPVAATNNSTSAILTNEGKLAVLTLIKGFKFKKKLMQEHFNQPKFMDSEKYPKAKFAGKVVDYKAETGEYKVVGKLTIHGVTKDVTTIANVKNVDGVTYLTTEFTVKVVDYGIEIKSKLAKKIAETVNLNVKLELK